MKVVGIVVAGVLVAGCAGEGTTGEANPPNRAVASPVERNSAMGEIAMLSEPQGMPLVEVGLPNTRNDRVTVRTIADNIVNPLPPAGTVIRPTTPAGVTIGSAATQPTTEPTTRPEEPTTRRGVRVDPLIGPGE